MLPLNKLHFQDFTFTQESMDLADALIAALHSHNAQTTGAARLGLDVLDDGSGRIRVFGESAALLGFCQTTKLRRLMAGAGVSPAVTPVPVDAPLVSLTRDNRADKAKPSQQRRRERRALERGEDMVHREVRSPVAALTLSVSSTSTKQNFLLKLKRKPCVSNESVVFSAYGLCLQGGIPAF